MNWQQVVADLWPQVRRKHLWPELPTPRLAKLDMPAGMQMRDKQITLDLATCHALAEHLPPTTIVEALLDHGVSHYTRCPWDLNTHLQLYATAKSVLQRTSLAKQATDAFIDVVANTSCVKELRTPLPDLYRHLEGGQLDGALAALYTQIWGIEINGSGDPELVRRLARIPYLERRQWPQSLRRFVQLLQPLLEEQGRAERSQPPALGHHSLDSYTSEEVARGLQAFAAEVEDIQQFRDTIEDFTTELVALGYGESDAAGEGLGTSIDAESLYYMQRAQRYRLPLRGVPMVQTGTMEPHGHTPWEAGKPVQDIDVWTSFGKFLPGLSQTWTRRQGEIYGQQESVPDCLVVLDSSGSMPNPRTSLSHAVLGAGCAIEAYLRRTAQVAVYNFSDARLGGKTVLPFTSDRQAIYRELCRYHGGGTSLRIRELEEIRCTATATTPDVLVITDMQIINLEEVINYLHGVEGRITVIHIGENKATERFRQAASTHPHLRIFTVMQSQDIPRIVLGQIRHYFSFAT